MKDINGQEIKVGDKVRFYHNCHTGIVIGFEQIGERTENVLVQNSSIGYEPRDRNRLTKGSGRLIANVWPYDIAVNSQEN